MVYSFILKLNKAGYSGTLCTIFNPCANNPCLNSGTCSVTGSTYTCSCLPGYSGTNCQICNIS